MNLKQTRWALALGYVFFIYATLTIVRIPVSFLRSMGLLRWTLGAAYATCFFLIFSHISREKSYRPLRILGLFLIAGSYWYTAQWVKTPEEQIHFFQYGLVGVLFFRALEFNLQNVKKIFLGALILATLSGWVDEILQGILPSRHYDVRDIYLNAISAFLGLLVLLLIGSSTPTKDN